MNPDDQDDVDDAEIVRRVRDILGGRLTAYIAGVQDTRIVRAWADGTAVPTAPMVRRLRLAGLLAARIRAQDPEMAQVWFMGMNPDLDDRSPALIIRESEPDLVEHDLLRALGAFLADQ